MRRLMVYCWVSPRPATPLAAPFFPLVNQQGQTISVPDGRGQAYLFKIGSNADPTDDYLIALGTYGW